MSRSFRASKADTALLVRRADSNETRQKANRVLGRTRKRNTLRQKRSKNSAVKVQTTYVLGGDDKGKRVEEEIRNYPGEAEERILF